MFVNLADGFNASAYLLWYPEYEQPIEHDGFNVDLLLAFLSKRGFLINFLVWYDEFFGQAGLVPSQLGLTS